MPTSAPPKDALHAVLVNRSVLVIDDNEAVRTALAVTLNLQQMRVLTAASPAEALDLLDRHAVDVIIQDMNFRRGEVSGQEGHSLFREIHRRHESIPVVLLTAFTHLESAVELVKAGAADYISKPWDESRLLTTLRNLVELSLARSEANALHHSRTAARAELAAKFDLCNMVYESESMHTVVSMATQVAHADVPVLITGPSGAGKEVLADIVHANSSVRNGPYIKENLGALPAELIEAELFGTESGAFTGARSRTGRFDAANGGTLFLDEIGNLPAAGQAKLLRVLQTGEYQALGSNSVRKSRVRIIAATNINMREAIRQQRFREDLFFRLNVIELELPALAERVDDIVPLAHHFLEPRFELTREAENALRAYEWPGNVRELQNVIRRACLLASSRELTAAMLALPRNEPARQEPDIDKSAIESALQRAQGVVAHAARELGLTRQALYRRMDKLGVKAPVGTITRTRTDR
jgi:DNA-binding NtrC family response regulator